jgi:hypothetical protein
MSSSKSTTVSLRTVFVISTIFFITGGALIYFLMNMAPGPGKMGPLPADVAYAYAESHRDRGLFSNWRGESHGTWYEPGDIKASIDHIDALIKSGKLKSPAGYQWKCGVTIGAKDRLHHPGSDGSRAKTGLMTMFLPVLVKDSVGKIDHGNEVLDYFQVRKYNKTSPSDKPSWESASGAAFRYDSLYKKYFEQFTPLIQKRRDCPECIIFDEGHLFP